MSLRLRGGRLCHDRAVDFATSTNSLRPEWARVETSGIKLAYGPLAIVSASGCAGAVCFLASVTSIVTVAATGVA